jgi:hypothetical protein
MTRAFALLALVAAFAAAAAQAGPPPGASAQCRDGTYSYSQHHSGTCLHHDGVAVWFDSSSSSTGGDRSVARAACGVERWTVKTLEDRPFAPAARGDDDPLPCHAVGAVDVAFDKAAVRASRVFGDGCGHTRSPRAGW